MAFVWAALFSSSSSPSTPSRSINSRWTSKSEGFYRTNTSPARPSHPSPKWQTNSSSLAEALNEVNENWKWNGGRKKKTHTHTHTREHQWQAAAVVGAYRNALELCNQKISIFPLIIPPSLQCVWCVFASLQTFTGLKRMRVRSFEIVLLLTLVCSFWTLMSFLRFSLIHSFFSRSSKVFCENIPVVNTLCVLVRLGLVRLGKVRSG